jgi:hypothetical protein
MRSRSFWANGSLKRSAHGDAPPRRRCLYPIRSATLSPRRARASPALAAGDRECAPRSTTRAPPPSRRGCAPSARVVAPGRGPSPVLAAPPRRAGRGRPRRGRAAQATRPRPSNRPRLRSTATAPRVAWRPPRARARERHLPFFPLLGEAPEVEQRSGRHPPRFARRCHVELRRHSQRDFPPGFEPRRDRHDQAIGTPPAPRRPFAVHGALQQRDDVRCPLERGPLATEQEPDQGGDPSYSRRSGSDARRSPVIGCGTPAAQHTEQEQQARPGDVAALGRELLVAELLPARV